MVKSEDTLSSFDNTRTRLNGIDYRQPTRDFQKNPFSRVQLGFINEQKTYLPAYVPCLFSHIQSGAKISGQIVIVCIDRTSVIFLHFVYYISLWYIDYSVSKLKLIYTSLWKQDVFNEILLILIFITSLLIFVSDCIYGCTYQTDAVVIAYYSHWRLFTYQGTCALMLLAERSRAHQTAN